MDYKVSVIIPVFNCEKYLSRAVDSVIAQPDFNEIQLILVNDGSTDGSAKICDNYADNYSNIIAVHQKNAGVSAARNRGIELAQGKWLAFLDSDDYLLNGIYKKMLEKPDAQLICCDYTQNSSSGMIGGYFKKDFYSKADFGGDLYTVMTDGPFFFQCWNKLYLTSVVKSCGLRFPDGQKLAEDMVFVFNYVEKIDSFRFVNEPLYFYFVSEGNTTSFVRNSFETNKFIYKFISDYFSRVENSERFCKKNVECFVFRSVLAISSSGTQLKFKQAYKYIKFILSDEEFFDLYTKENYVKFVCTFDKLLNGFIKKKNVLGIILLTKFYKAVTPLLKK